MSEQPVVAAVPEWDVADRMRKALRESGVGVQEIADYLGVARNTVSTWINGRIEPSKQTLRLWALRCGVSYEWLETGRTPSHWGDEGQPLPDATAAKTGTADDLRRVTKHTHKYATLAPVVTTGYDWSSRRPGRRAA
jgi:transcriptional regulator with XRE-family HTH domain